MYNDYYLQSIDGKMSANNTLLNEIIDNQETIITNQQQLISGDYEIISNQTKLNNSIILVAMICSIILIYLFIVRSMKQ